mmetsp:Transcript_20288/g.24246  ORF Transcript_20288/g.24246 Transcript_20288/m.24246 type:complete len:231 (+) Transcript_20288:120-812(+)
MSWVLHDTGRHVSNFHKRQAMFNKLRLDESDPYETHYMSQHGGPRSNKGQTPIHPTETFLSTYKQDFITGRMESASESQILYPRVSTARSGIDKPTAVMPAMFQDTTDEVPDYETSSALASTARSTKKFGYTNEGVMHASSILHNKSISQLPPIRRPVRNGGMRKGALDHAQSLGWNGRMAFDGVNKAHHRGKKMASSVDFRTMDADIDWSSSIKPYSTGWNSSTNTAGY